MSDDKYYSNNHFNLLTNKLPDEFLDLSSEVVEYYEEDNEGSDWEDSDISKDTSENTECGGSSDKASMLEVPSSRLRQSSPVTGTRSEKAENHIQKGHIKCQTTLEKLKEGWQAEAVRIKAAAREAEKARH